MIVCVGTMVFVGVVVCEGMILYIVVIICVGVMVFVVVVAVIEKHCQIAPAYYHELYPWC